jgi:hypothetical protein
MIEMIRDFNNQEVTIKVAFITVGGILFSVLVNLLSNLWRDIAASKEKFKYERYYRRISVYEDVIKELQQMQMVYSKKMKGITAGETAKIIMEINHMLNGLIARLILFGSANSVRFLEKLLDSILVIQDNCLASQCSETIGKEAAVALMAIIEIALSNFTVIVSKEVSQLCEKKICKYLGKVSFGTYSENNNEDGGKDGKHNE